jgi:hypothetical protein
MFKSWRIFAIGVVFVGLFFIVLHTSPSAKAETHTMQSSDVVKVIQKVFKGYSSQALRVAQCESGVNPFAINPMWIGNSRATGLFQIMYPSTWMSTSERGNSPYDVGANTRAAFELFKRSGYTWRLWVCKP